MIRIINDGRRKFPSGRLKPGTTIPVPIIGCDKCGHRWVPRKPEVPDECPRCGPEKAPAGQRGAMYEVQRAIYHKRLPRLDGAIKCTDCPKPAKVYEHRDYNKPLEVEPVCHGCNQRRGRAKEKTNGRG